MIHVMTDLNDLLKHTSRSLYLSARLLPAAVRDTFSIAYLLCRYADSIADTPLLPPQQRLYWIQFFPSLITHLDLKKVIELKQQIASGSSSVYEEQLLRNLPACVAAFEKLTSWEQEIILEVVRAVCRGMETDLQTFPDEKSGQIKAFQTAADLENYCHLMGGAPGVFWSKLIAHTVPLPLEEKQFVALGREIGDAEQIVNILRDLPRDLRIGRCYFPQEELYKNQLQTIDLTDPKNSPRFEPIKQKWIAWGRRKIQAVIPYFTALPKRQLRHRAAVAWPILWAADTLNKIEQEPDLLNPAIRVKIPRSRIYATMALTPLILASNQLFTYWIQHKTLYK